MLGERKKADVEPPKKKIRQIDIYYEDGTVESIIYKDDKTYSRTVYH